MHGWKKNERGTRSPPFHPALGRKIRNIERSRIGAYPSIRILSLNLRSSKKMERCGGCGPLGYVV